MTPTRRARELARAAADARIAAEKARYREGLERIKAAFAPPLSNAELSVALGLHAPDEGATGQSEVGRFVSESPRLKRVRPDSECRGLIDALLSGELLIAAMPSAGGGRRPTLVLTDHDLARLERGWQVVSLRTGPILRDDAAATWDDPTEWNRFGGAVRHAAPPGTRWLADLRLPPVGLGAMRLSTVDSLSDRDAEALVETALERGIRLFDSADAYCLGEDDIGANERLLSRVLRRAGADAIVATKVGLTRPGGRWVPDAHPEHVARAIEACLRAQGVDALDLVQLHAVDRRVPIEESVGALAELADRGHVRRIGVCNVDHESLSKALATADIVSVQNPASYARPGTLLDPEFRRTCAAHGVAFIAHSPLGGHARRGAMRGISALEAVAGELGVSPERVALAWLLSLGPEVFAIPGATREASLRDSAAALELRLSARHLAVLDAAHAEAAAVREAADASRPLVGDGAVLILGMPASGKSTHVRRFEARGYARFNRDDRGGTLAALIPPMRDHFEQGGTRVVADNTYPTRAARGEVIRAAEASGLSTAALWMDTPLQDALQNACHRMLDRRGRLLDPDELTAASREDPNMLPPAALHRFAQAFEAPTTDEGLSAVVRVPFVRRRPPGTRAAVIFDFDGTLRICPSGAPYPRTVDDVSLLPGRAEVVAALRDAGVLLLGVSNQSGVATGALTQEQARALFDATCALLKAEIDVRFCPHRAVAARCWCRKPMPGLGVVLTRDHALDPARCVFVGDRESDREFAHNCGFEFSDPDDFFASGWRRWVA